MLYRQRRRRSIPNFSWFVASVLLNYTFKRLLRSTKESTPLIVLTCSSNEDRLWKEMEYRLHLLRGVQV